MKNCGDMSSASVQTIDSSAREFARTLSCAEVMTASDAVDGIFDALVGYARDFGLEYVFVGKMTGDVTLTGARLYYALSTYPEDWTARYADKNYIFVDPVISQILKSTTPFRYADSYKNNTPAQDAFKADAEAHGMKDALVIPVHSVGQPAGAVVYASQSPLKLNSTVEACLEMIGRLAMRLIDTHFTPAPGVDIPTLTDREREILGLVASGKTNWEIGVILELSEYSVRDYMQALSKRLGTSNRTHTVTRAAKLGLILL